MLRVACVPLALSLLPSFLFSQRPPWRVANGSAGIEIAAIDVYRSNPDTLNAFGRSFLRSTDRGESWHNIAGPTTDYGALRIDPFSSQILYVSHYGFSLESNDVSMTTDAGQTWRLLFHGWFCTSPVIEIDPGDLNTVYVAQGPGVLHRTSDRGQTWEDIVPPAPCVLSLAIAPSDNRVLYTAHPGPIFI